MEAKEQGITSAPNGSAKDGVVTCSTCGKVLRRPQEWVKGANGTIICATCYQEILFPNIKPHAMEVFD
jgi:formylmethanofuran dehydrogenase subunit E